jgi:TetR/AcrR family transcriptional repressor of nem operon
MKEEISKAERTRAYIIERTAPIFNTKGYAGTSLNDMTEATGLTKGSIYGNFANKDEVALAVFDYNLQKVSVIITAELSKAKTVRDKLLVYADVYTNFKIYPFPAGGCPIQNTAIDADDTHPALKAKAAKAINNWKKEIASLIEDGKTVGEFDNTINTERIALTMIAMIEGSIMMANVTGKTEYRKLVMESVSMFIKGL